MFSTFDFLPQGERWFLAYDRHEDHKPTAQLSGYGREDYEAAVARLTREGHDVWTARAGFDGEAKTRTGRNVTRLQCFSIDIDVDARGHVGKGDKTGKPCHASPMDAAVAFARLVQSGVAPRPSVVVSSGGGLHVWWRLTDALTPAEWSPLAAALRDAIAAADPLLAADTTRWTDTSGLLRPWPSINMKTGAPRPVVVLRDTGVDHTPYSFAQSVRAAAPSVTPRRARQIATSPA